MWPRSWPANTRGTWIGPCRRFCGCWCKGVKSKKTDTDTHIGTKTNTVALCVRTCVCVNGFLCPVFSEVGIGRVKIETGIGGFA